MNKHHSQPKNILIYGATWCGDCTRAKMWLNQNGYRYEYKDVDTDQNALRDVLDYNMEIKKEAFRSIPVIIIGEGKNRTVLIEPKLEELASTLGA